MSSQVKNIVIVISIVIISILSYKNVIISNESDTTSSILNEKESVIQRILLDNGKLKQEKKSAIINAAEKSQIIANYQEEVEDIKENHDVDLKRVHAYYRAQMITNNSGESILKDTTIIIGDTVKTYPSINVNDGFLSLNGYFDSKVFKYDYSVTDSISIVYHWKMKGLWPFKKKDYLMVSFNSQNPNTILQSASSFTIQDTKKTRLSIGPYIGYGTNGISIGIGLQYPIIRVPF